MESKKIDKQWLVAYCKSRNEKLSAERLTKAGIEVYCPLYVTVRQWSDRKKKVKTPVFPSYVFLHINEQERLQVLQDPGIVRFVFWLGKPAVIRDEEMFSLKSFIDSNNKENTDFILQEGTNVKIESGPFKNLEGVVSHASNKIPRIVIKDLGITLIANNTLQISEK